MKIVKKIFIPATPQIFTPIRATTTSSYEVVELVRDKVDIPEPIAEEITETYEIPPDDEDVGNQYFYGAEEPSSRPYEQNSVILLGDKWYNTTEEIEYTYLPEFEGSENLVWIPTGSTGSGGGGGIGEPWGITFPTKATNLEGIPAGTTFALGTSATSILEKLLYPIFLEFTAFDIGITPKIYHVGATTTPNIYLASWTLNDNENALDGSLRIFQGSNVFPESLGLNPSDTSVSINHEEYSRTSEGSVVFTVAVTGNSGESVTRDSSLSWRYPVYGGKTSISSLTSLADLQSLRLSSGSNPIISYSMAQLKSGVVINVPETPTGTQEYFYWLVTKEIDGSPVSPSPPQYNPQVGSFSNITDPDAPSPLPMLKVDDVTISSYGLNITFDVYKSVNALGGSLVIRTKE